MKVKIDGTEYELRFPKPCPPEVRLVLSNGQTAILTFNGYTPDGFMFKGPPVSLEKRDDTSRDCRWAYFGERSSIDPNEKLFDGTPNPQHGKIRKVKLGAYCEMRLVPWAPGEDFPPAPAEADPDTLRQAVSELQEAKRNLLPPPTAQWWEKACNRFDRGNGTNTAKWEQVYYVACKGVFDGNKDSDYLSRVMAGRIKKKLLANKITAETLRQFVREHADAYRRAVEKAHKAAAGRMT